MGNEVKNIQMVLYDGTLEGLVKCTLDWEPEVLYKFSREQVLNKSLDNRPEFNHNGIYFLLGYTESGEPKIYVGQASTRKSGGGLLSRIQEHTKSADKDFFTEVVILTTEGDKLGPTELNYLEHVFTMKAKEVNQYILHNGNEPSMGNISEEQRWRVMPFVEHTPMLLRALGHPALMKVAGVKQIQDEVKEGDQGINDISNTKDTQNHPSSQNNQTNQKQAEKDAEPSRKGEKVVPQKPVSKKSIPKKSARLGKAIVADPRMEGLELHIYQKNFMKSGKEFRARCEVRKGQYVVLAGSQIRLGYTNSFVGATEYYQKLELEASGIIKDGVLMQDVAFSSASAAAKVVLGRSANGVTEWKLADGKPLGSLLEQK